MQNWYLEEDKDQKNPLGEFALKQMLMNKEIDFETRLLDPNGQSFVKIIDLISFGKNEIQQQSVSTIFPDDLTKNILVTVFTMNPIGVVAIYFSMKVRGADDLDQKKKYLKYARIWAIITLLSALALFIWAMVKLSVLVKEATEGLFQMPF